ncbi:MAG: enoyl-CoA hydratase [Gammaproteobacteria bacterium]|nr:enoyl-CoA hydratase [Gammaproteobacteria bacterium]
MTYEQILFSTEGEVGVLTLNRPERMNAWTQVMREELTDAISACNEDPGIGAMVITGAGRGFCAGADIKQNFQARIDGQDPERSGRNSVDWVSLLRSSKPIVAAVNGASVGVGTTMILPCDVIIASEAAKFAMAFIKMGLVPELASSHFLVQRMGFGRASEMCLSGRLYSATEAHAAGLVDRLAKPEALMDTALETARSFAANPTPQLRWVKQLLTENGSATDLSQVQKREGTLLQQAYKTPEHKEAVAAFLEKRPADFRKLTG